MAQNDHLATDASRRGTFSSARLRRLGVYLIAVVAMCVVVWALIDGGQRDLWSTPSTQGFVQILSLRVL